MSQSSPLPSPSGTAATAKDKGRLQRIIRSAEKVFGCNLPSLQDLYASRTLRVGKIYPTHLTFFFTTSATATSLILAIFCAFPHIYFISNFSGFLSFILVFLFQLILFSSLLHPPQTQTVWDPPLRQDAVDTDSHPTPIVTSRYINVKPPHLTPCITLTHILSIIISVLHTVDFCIFRGQ